MHLQTPKLVKYSFIERVFVLNNWYYNKNWSPLGKVLYTMQISQLFSQTIEPQARYKITRFIQRMASRQVLWRTPLSDITRSSNTVEAMYTNTYSEIVIFTARVHTLTTPLSCPLYSLQYAFTSNPSTVPACCCYISGIRSRQTRASRDDFSWR